MGGAPNGSNAPQGTNPQNDNNQAASGEKPSDNGNQPPEMPDSSGTEQNGTAPSGNRPDKKPDKKPDDSTVSSSDNKKQKSASDETSSQS